MGAAQQRGSSGGGRVAVFDLANERIVLATMAHEAGDRRRLARDLSASEFGDPKHRVLFSAMSALVRGGLEFSEDTLADLAGGAKNFGGFDYLRALLRDYAPSPNLAHHIDRLRLDAAKYSLLSEDIPAIVAGCEDPKASADPIASRLRGALGRVERTGRRFVQRGSELREGYWETLRLRAITGNVKLGTGWPVMDRGLVRGFVPGLSVVAGRPGHGKTTWLANFLLNQLRAERPTYVCGWEMMREDYIDMMVSASTGILAADLALQVDRFSDADKQRIVDAVGRITNRDLIAIEQNPFPHLEPCDRRWKVNERNLAYFDRLVSQEADKYSLFALDVVMKMLADRSPEAISEALVQIRELAYREGVHIMCLHHMNRTNAEDRPSLEGLKGSGAWEEEADIVLGLDRPILRASPARRKKMIDHLDVHVLKQRKGPAPYVVRYLFDGPRFELSSETEVDISMLEDDSRPGADA